MRSRFLLQLIAINQKSRSHKFRNLQMCQSRTAKNSQQLFFVFFLTALYPRNMKFESPNITISSNDQSEKMEVAKEFLGDFSIVGFSHILSAKSQVQFRHLVCRYNQQKSGVETQVVKLGWALIIIIAFVTAGFLIHANFKGKTLSIKIFSDLYLHLSLADWESSPVSTTLTVHPISEATFPRFMP